MNCRGGLTANVAVSILFGNLTEAVARSRGVSRMFFHGRWIAVLALLQCGCAQSSEIEKEKPSFGNVTTTFKLARNRIKKDEKLQVHVVFRNDGTTASTFYYYDFSVDARLYKNGENLGVLCPTADNPVLSVVLKPGETFEIEDDLFITRCYHLAPGRYSIRFNYNLSLVSDAALRAQYEHKYHHPAHGIVSWDGREHWFTVIND